MLMEELGGFKRENGKRGANPTYFLSLVLFSLTPSPHRQENPMLWELNDRPKVTCALSNPSYLPDAINVFMLSLFMVQSLQRLKQRV